MLADREKIHGEVVELWPRYKLTGALWTTIFNAHLASREHHRVSNAIALHRAEEPTLRDPNWKAVKELLRSAERAGAAHRKAREGYDNVSGYDEYTILERKVGAAIVARFDVDSRRTTWSQVLQDNERVVKYSREHKTEPFPSDPPDGEVMWIATLARRLVGESEFNHTCDRMFPGAGRGKVNDKFVFKPHRSGFYAVENPNYRKDDGE